MKKDLIKKIFYSTVILNVLFSPSLLSAQAQGQGLVKCGFTDPQECNFEKLVQLATDVIVFLIQLGLIFAAIAFAYAGFLYMTAQGKEDQIKKAHGIFKNVLFGFILAMLAYVVVKMIASSFGYQSNII